MLIHATITISGDRAMRIACEATLRRLLSGQFIRNEVTEHHGDEALCYDLKVEGGIPFPVFAQASQEFPTLTFDARWVNVAQGEKGGATIVNGRVTARETERIAVHTGDEHPVHVEVAPDGRLRLALTLFRATQDEWRGYALTATRDALVRVVRRSSGEVELDATDGAAEWALSWRGEKEGATPARAKDARPGTIDKATFSELDAIARRFAQVWIWFEGGPKEDAAVEADRYERYGYPVSPANVRSARLHRMRADAAEGAALVHSTLGPEDEWVKDLLLETWAKISE
jgi:hypothetical protein